MKNFFTRSIESGAKNKDSDNGEIIEKNELPQCVEDEIEKIKTEYNSASNNGLFRIKDYKKINLENGIIHYLINGTLDIHAPNSLSGENYVGDDNVQFIIEVQDGKVLKIEKKFEKELLAA